MIKIYNSLTNQLEDFQTIKPGEVMMYVCGPTVYSHMHIGNTRPVVFFDTVHRFFNYLKFQVHYVSNFTDIDDKIIQKAMEEQTTEDVISEQFIAEAIKLYKKLNCLEFSATPRVTNHIDAIVEFIQLLVRLGGAYVVDGDVYFRVSNLKDYGLLSGQSVDKLISGSRIEENDKKEHPADFTLWKKTETGLRWDSPWSMGRPGWHTECVVMVDHFFQGKIDIHGGGLDLKFPHHDNEIAQAQCAHNHMISNYWMHNGRIDLSGEKMSKSIGNVIWAKDLLEEIGHYVYRLMILNVPYRQPMLYRDELSIQASVDFEKMKRAYIGVFRKLELEHGVLDDMEISLQELVSIKQAFIKAMEDDFNTANAITAIFQLVKMMNAYIRNENTSIEYLQQSKTLLYEFMWVLGIEIDLPTLTNADKDLVFKWQKARTDKDFALADKYRSQLQSSGVEL